MGRRDAIKELLIQVADEEQEQTQNADMVFLVSAVELTNWNLPQDVIEGSIRATRALISCPLRMTKENRKAFELKSRNAGQR